jgi:hypothetical protein
LWWSGAARSYNRSYGADGGREAFFAITVMTSQRTSIIHGSAIGALVGGFMGLCFLFGPAFGLDKGLSISTLFETLNMPAFFLATLWTDVVRLPPRGDIGEWVLVPAVAITLQWIVLGVAVAVARQFIGRADVGRRPKA